MDRGDLVPDEVTVAMVRDRLAEDDAKDGFLLDGFPRNVPQAETLKKMLAEMDVKLTVVLELEVDEDEVVRRLSGRRTCRRCERVWHLLYDPPTREGICDDCGGELFQRDDDKEEVIRHRLEVYVTRRRRWSRSTPKRASSPGSTRRGRSRRSPAARWRPWSRTRRLLGGSCVFWGIRTNPQTPGHRGESLPPITPLARAGHKSPAREQPAFRSARGTPSRASIKLREAPVENRSLALVAL